MRVTQLFADHLSALINEDDVIWVHDYHLMVLARELRSRGHRNRIGFFLHTPCAPPDILQTLPHHRGDPRRTDLLRSGRIPDRKRSRQFRPVSGEPGRDADARRLRDRRPAGPARRLSGEHRNEGVHAPCAQCGALSHGCSRARSLGGSRLVLSVDRLDCSKGIPQRIKAFERFLEMNPEWHGKATLVQLTPKSWSDIKQYSEIKSEVAGLIGKVNGRFGDAAWTPIRYVNRSYSRTVLAGIYRAADVAMTTPLRDGMNLAAKEFLAAQDPDDPGVLMLSQFAGAAKELDEALIVNPHETDAVAAALKRALEMPREERRERHAPMLAHLLKNDIKRWSRSYTSALVDGKTGRGLLEAVRALLKPTTAQTPRAALRSVVASETVRPLSAPL